MTRASSGSSFTNKFEYIILKSAIVKQYAEGSQYTPGSGTWGGSGSFAGGLSVGGNLGVTGSITSVTNVTASGTVTAPTGNITTVNATTVGATTGNITTVNATTGNIANINSTTTNTGTVSATGAISCQTINTGAGAVECYAMNQNVRTTDSPTFASIQSGSGYIKWKLFSGAVSADIFAVTHGISSGSVLSCSVMIQLSGQTNWIDVLSDGSGAVSVRTSDIRVARTGISGGLYRIILIYQG
jgi:hypothetical protein